MESVPARIHELEAQLANQIAAGEVVERPGSALKELVENSLDAAARSITVKIAGGGMELLEVLDNGHGIHPEDLQLALSRHATSKIRRSEDLFAIRSWGFRGEALASIAAVSRLTLSSRHQDAPLGRELIAEGGGIRSTRELARPVGTTLRIEDLFFNTPARKKFLKGTAAETGHCWQSFHRLALGSPACGFEAWQDGEKRFQYPAVSDPATRVVQVFQEAWGLRIREDELIRLEADSAPLRMRAFLLPAKHFIPSSRGILCFVNGRSVKDKLLQQAILAAAREVLFGRLFPQLVLHLETPPDWVDVNVHPAKAELRFREPGHVFAFVRKYLQRQLAADRGGSIQGAPPEGPALPAPGRDAIESVPTLADLLLPFDSGAVQFHQKAAPAAQLPARRQGPQFLGTLRNTYLVCQEENGLLLIDQHAAHERVSFERLKRTRLSTAGSSPLLISLQIELPRSALDRCEAELPRLAPLGLLVERTGPSLVAVRELPNLLLRRDGTPILPPGELLRRIVGDWEELREGSLEDRLHELLLETLASESCHGSVRAGQSLAPAEAEALLAEMSETDFSGHCPHGRPTTLRFSWTEIERLFKRSG